MAEENQNKYETTSEVEIKDRGVFDFLGKKKEEEKPQDQEVIVTEFEKVKVSDHEPETKVEEKKEEEDGEKKKHSLLEKLHRSNSSSSSVSFFFFFFWLLLVVCDCCLSDQLIHFYF